MSLITDRTFFCFCKVFRPRDEENLKKKIVYETTQLAQWSMNDEWQIREFAKRATNGSYFCVSDDFLGHEPWTYVQFGACEVRLLTVASAFQNKEEKEEEGKKRRCCKSDNYIWRDAWHLAKFCDTRMFWTTICRNIILTCGFVAWTKG